MRGTKAKKIRNLAELVSQGKKDRSYQKHDATGQIALESDCTRRVYKRLKADYKAGRVNDTILDSLHTHLTQGEAA